LSAGLVRGSIPYALCGSVGVFHSRAPYIGIMCRAKLVGLSL